MNAPYFYISMEHEKNARANPFSPLEFHTVGCPMVSEPGNFSIPRQHPGRQTGIPQIIPVGMECVPIRPPL